ncbi:hypothetical protein H2200_008180 [Cladophialophora chaetospira]|uniref:DUF6603 domain-containing protein n=1 Tax=Cladophialophora chaetospira TaxID=386627 RepID=A0AA38X5A3_9EURO|nr:hypothetical protein H2200_008180 [Cladophialophora chaetospira]
MAPTPAPTLSPFLKPNPDPSQPAAFDKTGDWATIITDAKLTITDVGPQSTTDNANVTATNNEFWGLQFTSAQNAAYFKPSQATNTLHNNGWTGDAEDSAVLLLASDATKSLPVLGTGSICEAFGITPAALPDTSRLKSFLNTALAKSGLNADLHQIAAPPSNPNAMWCLTTTDSYQTIVQLSFTLDPQLTQDDGPLAKAVTWVNSQLGLDISIQEIRSKFSSVQIPDILFTLRQTTTYSFPGLAATSTWSLSFGFTIIDFNCSIDFTSNGMNILLEPTASSGDIFSSLVAALHPPDSAGLDSSQMPSSSDSIFSTLFKHVDLWNVNLNLTEDIDGGGLVLNWGVGILLTWTVGNENTPLVAALSYDSLSSMFSGQLLLQGNVPSETDQRQAGFDHRAALPVDVLASRGIVLQNLPPSINPFDLVGDSGHRPSVLPFSIAGAQMSYQNLLDGSVFSFSAIMVNSTPKTSSSDEVPSGFVWDQISLDASLAKIKPVAPETKPTTRIKLGCVCSMTLNPTHNPGLDSAHISVTLAYDNSTGSSDWLLLGSVTNLKVAHIADLFDDDCSEGAMAVLGQLDLASLDVLYAYSAGKASSFLVQAVLKLGDLELDLSYQYVKKALHIAGTKTAAQLQWGDSVPTGLTLLPDPAQADLVWVFEAVLKVGSPDSTIGSVAESIKPGSMAQLPPFVRDIKLSPLGSTDNSPVKLRYSGDNAKGSTLVAFIGIGPFNLTFVQTRTAATAGATATLKRLIRVSVDQIPYLDHVPLIGQLPQPFDHLLYFWVEDDDDAQVDKTKKGFTRGMIDGVNKILQPMNVAPVQMKEIKTTKDDLMELATGHHFEIIVNGKVVLDHLFETKKSTPAGNGSNGAEEERHQAAENSAKRVVPVPVKKQVSVPARKEASASVEKDTSSDSTDATEAPPTTGATNGKAGPLTLTGLSLQYKNGSLFVGVDATLMLGPLTFAVKGFTIELELSQVKLDSLADIITKKLVHVTLSGLEAGVSQDPLTLKGHFAHVEGSDSSGDSFDSYQGGIAVGFKAWDMLAVGEYRVTTLADKSQYKSVFVYGKLDGPLVELEFATISGVRLGFGYNSMVTLPMVENLYQFPFINDAGAAGAGNDPMKVLDQMLAGTPPYVQSKQDSCWVCAGMTITCFDCITLTAVLMFDVNTSPQGGLDMALLADGVFQMEPLAPADACLFYIELLIKVELNFIDGYIAADATLAPASHVYVPEARLTGSGSFYSWFAPNSHAGDWVVSVGGYHRAYAIPSHYPQPARLGLNFTVGDNIQIIGTGYIAVTPKCAMAGGTLHMSLSVGPVDAYCDLALDVFVNFKPFYFVASISLSVGVDCDIDLLFIHFHVSIHIGSDLTVWGPKSFGGLAHVDFWFFGFDIHFGGGRNTGGAASLADFYKMVMTPGPKSDPPPTDGKSAGNPYMAQHKYSIEAGIFPVKPDPDPSPDPTKQPAFPDTGANSDWIVQAGTLQFRIDCDFALSSAKIINSETDDTKNLIMPDPKKKQKPLDPIFSVPMRNTLEQTIKSWIEIRVYSTEGGVDVLQDNFRAELVMKSAAAAMWSQYNKDDDPLVNSSPGTLQNGQNPTVTLCQGVRIKPPEPKLAPCPVIDFDATAVMLGPIDDTMLPAQAEQTTFLSKLFTPKNPATAWKDFGDLWTGVTGGVTDDGVKKSDIRGDGTLDGGMMGLCAQALGWNRRPPADKVGSVDVKGDDGRYEWQLKSDPPTILAEQELGFYYFALPMVA